jgi:NADPH:quinone reductase-like Zn-dependent oxidoreductase
MSTDQVNTVLAAASCCNWSIQEVAIFSAVFLAILVVLKNHFRGGQFNIPKVDLSGKYAVVTGGNSGIGAETVRELSKLGCEVVIGARSKETAEEVIKSIRKENPNAKV